MEPSELAIAYAKDVIVEFAPSGDFDTYMKRIKKIATMFDEFARLAVETEREGIIKDLNQQKIIDTNPHALTDKMKHYNSVLGDAISIVKHR